MSPLLGIIGRFSSFSFSLDFKFIILTYNHLIDRFTGIGQIGRMKKKSDFLQQMKNSQQFLNKLNNFKKASKDIKDKNKLISHRNIWVKQYKYLTRLLRDQDLQNLNYFQLFDKYFAYEIEDRQIFGKQNEKSYTELLKSYEQQSDHYEVKIWKQLKSLPLLLNRIKQNENDGKKGIEVKEAAGIMVDISKFLTQEEKAINDDLDNLQKMQMTMSKVSVLDAGHPDDEEENEFAFLQDLLIQHNFDDVRGFDFQTNQLRRIEEGQKYLKQYIQSLSDRLTEDEISSVINEYHHASDLLNQTLQLQLQKIALDYEQALSLDSGLLSMSENYQIINHIYNTYLGRGKSVSLYSERLSIQFPNLSKKKLDRMTQYIEAKIYKSRKSNASKRNFLREKQQMLQKVEKEVNDRIEIKIKKAQKEAERLQRKEQKIKLEKELDQLRVQFQQRKAQKERVIREEEQKQKQQERKRDAVRKLYLDELNKKAAEVHQIKQKKQKEEEEKIRLQKEQQQKNLKKQIDQNRHKVHQRQTNEESKIQKKLEWEKQRREQPAKNEERINKAIETYSFRPNVEFSEERLNAPTEGMIKRKQTTYDKADKIELTKMTGYNINQLMGDRRFKLNTALFEAGLANTEYAREVLNKMSKRPENT